MKTTGDESDIWVSFALHALHKTQNRKNNLKIITDSWDVEPRFSTTTGFKTGAIGIRRMGIGCKYQKKTGRILLLLPISGCYEFKFDVIL